MDAINIIIQIRTFADFVTDKVQSMAEFNKSYAEIAQKFQQDLLFLHSFEALFVEDDGNFIRNENISEHIAVSQGILSSMGRLFSEYKSIAEEYQESESADEAGSLCQQAKRRVSWAICGKRKTMDVLKQYSAYTQKLHETTTLMMLTLAAPDNGYLREIANRKQARALFASIPMLPDEFTALGGRLQIDNEEADSHIVGSYIEENGRACRVMVEFRQYGAQGHEDALHSTRQLAWFLHRASLSDTIQASSQTTTQAIPFVGYQHDPARRRDVFIFPAFDENTPSTSLNETIRNHGESSAAAGEYTLGHRFMLATHLALMVFGLRNFRCVHRNISSHSVIVQPPTSERPRFSQLVGWESAAEETDGTEPVVDNPAHDHTLYRHPPLGVDESHNPNATRDIYSLGIVLLEIGLWTVVADIYDSDSAPSHQATDPESLRTISAALAGKAERDLPSRMGQLYADAVRECLKNSIGTYRDCDEQTKATVALRKLVMDAVEGGRRL